MSSESHALNRDSSSDAFWRDPPWRGGKTQFRMGLSEIGGDGWLPKPIDEAELARKGALLAAQPERVLRTVPGHEAAEAGVVAAIAAELGRRNAAGGERRPYPVEPAARRLREASLWVPDDLCLLVPGDDGYRLVSACVCSPSYWRLAEKIGKPIQGVHGPVRGLNEAVGHYVARFFANLPVGRIFQRRNWLIHRSDELFHPEPERWQAPLEPAQCEALFVRSETQTLRKFDGGAVLFTIRVGTHPLAGIARFPAAAADLLKAIERMSDDERRSFGYRHHGAALRAYLGTVAAAADG